MPRSIIIPIVIRRTIPFRLGQQMRSPVRDKEQITDEMDTDMSVFNGIRFPVRIASVEPRLSAMTNQIINRLRSDCVEKLSERALLRFRRRNRGEKRAAKVPAGIRAGLIRAAKSEKKTNIQLYSTFQLPNKHS